MKINDFIKKSDPQTRSLILNQEQTRASVLSVLSMTNMNLMGLKPKDSQKISQQISELTHSDEFIDTLSEAIGEPKSDESQDEFVSRAKLTMKNILLARFK